MQFWSSSLSLPAKAVRAWLGEFADGWEVAPGMIQISGSDLASKLGAGEDDLRSVLDELAGSGFLSYRLFWPNYAIYLPDRLALAGNDDAFTAFYLECLQGRLSENTNNVSAEPAKRFFETPITADPTPDDARKQDTEEQNRTLDPPDSGIPAILESIENSVLDPVLQTNSPGGGPGFSPGGGLLGASEAQRPGDSNQPGSELGVNNSDQSPTKHSQDLGSQLKDADSDSAGPANKNADKKKSDKKKPPRRVEHVAKGDEVTSPAEFVCEWIDGFRRETLLARGYTAPRSRWSSKSRKSVKDLLAAGYTVADFQQAWRVQAASELWNGDQAAKKKALAYFSWTTVHREKNFARNLDTPLVDASDEIASSGESREYTDHRKYEDDQIGDIR